MGVEAQMKLSSEGYRPNSVTAPGKDTCNLLCTSEAVLLDSWTKA